MRAELRVRFLRARAAARRKRPAATRSLPSLGSGRRPARSRRSCDGPPTSPARTSRPPRQSTARLRRASPAPPAPGRVRARPSRSPAGGRHARRGDRAPSGPSTPLMRRLVAIEVDLGERRADVAGVDREVELDEHPERLLEQSDTASSASPSRCSSPARLLRRRATVAPSPSSSNSARARSAYVRASTQRPCR